MANTPGTQIILSGITLWHELIKAIEKKNGICNLAIYCETLPERKARSFQLTFKLFTEITGKGIQEARAADIMLFLKQLEIEYTNNATYNSKFYEIGKLFELYQADGIIKVNYFKQLRLIKRIKPRPVSKAIEELPVNYNDVLNVIVDKDQVSIIIRALFNTGMRISELTGIRHIDIKQINDFEKSIHIYRKGNKQADIKISNELYNDIRSIYSGDHEYLFYTGTGKQYNTNNIYKQVTRKFDKYFNRKHLTAALEGKRGKEKREVRKAWEKKKYHIRPHFMRHLFACYKLLVEKESPKAVSEALSHSSTSITQDMYCHDRLSKWHII